MGSELQVGLTGQSWLWLKSLMRVFVSLPLLEEPEATASLDLPPEPHSPKNFITFTTIKEKFILGL